MPGAHPTTGPRLPLTYVTRAVGVDPGPPLAAVLVPLHPPEARLAGLALRLGPRGRPLHPPVCKGGGGAALAAQLEWGLLLLLLLLLGFLRLRLPLLWLQLFLLLLTNWRRRSRLRRRRLLWRRRQGLVLLFPVLLLQLLLLGLKGWSKHQRRGCQGCGPTGQRQLLHILPFSGAYAG